MSVLGHTPDVERHTEKADQPVLRKMPPSRIFVDSHLSPPKRRVGSAFDGRSWQAMIFKEKENKGGNDGEVSSSARRRSLVR